LSKLLKLKEWLTVPEAARHLSILFGEEIGEADVLRLALDGYLTLSLLLTHPNSALCGKIITVDDASKFFDPSNITDPDKREDGVARAKQVLIDRSDNQVLDIEGDYHVDGVWDLLMRGGERYYVEDQYHRLIDGPGVYPFSLEEGIYLIKEPEGMACRLRPELPDGGIPNDSFLVVRTGALQELEQLISNAEKPENKPLGKRERDNLLVIIAALAKLAKVDLTKPSAAAKAVETQLLLMGVQEPKARTIENHFKKAAEVFVDRS
jgi:hypothetical protein